jgi:hypothetical protein
MLVSASCTALVALCASGAARLAVAAVTETRPNAMNTTVTEAIEEVPDMSTFLCMAATSRNRQRAAKSFFATRGAK